jgi:hypothetical protein
MALDETPSYNMASNDRRIPGLLQRIVRRH